MKRVLFFTMPYGGHISPNIQLIKEFNKRNIKVMVYCDSKFRSIFNYDNIDFVSYPNEILEFCNYTGDMTFDKQQAANNYFSNLINYNTVMLRKKEEERTCKRFTQLCSDQINNFSPQLVIYDSQISWIKEYIDLINCPVLELNCSTYIPSYNKSESFKDYYKNIIFQECTSPITYDNLLNLIRKAGQTHRRQQNKNQRKLTFSYHSPLLQDEVDLLSNDVDYLGYKLSIDTQQNQTKNGIYITRGTVSESYSSNLLLDTVNCFNNSEFDVTVSLGNSKMANENFKDKKFSDNIKIQAYTNQIDELQKSLIFVTHGGITGVKESLLCGTPMIIIPANFPDYQVGRAIKKENAGFLIDKRPLDKEDIIKKCTVILNNYEYYLENVQRISNQLAYYWDNVGIEKLIKKCEDII